MNEQFDPTLNPSITNFNAVHDAGILRMAIQRAETDEKAIIKVLAHRSVEQRMEILHSFKTMYGGDLFKELHSKLSGHFRDCIEALCYPMDEFDASQLRKAMRSSGSDETVLTEILGTKSNEELVRIRDAYHRREFSFIWCSILFMVHTKKIIILFWMIAYQH